MTLTSRPPEEHGETSEDEEEHPVHLARTGKAVFFQQIGQLWRKKFEWGDDGEKRLEEIMLGQARQLTRLFENEEESFEAITLPA